MFHMHFEDNKVKQDYLQQLVCNYYTAKKSANKDLFIVNASKKFSDDELRDAIETALHIVLVEAVEDPLDINLKKLGAIRNDGNLFAAYAPGRGHRFFDYSLIWDRFDDGHKKFVRSLNESTISAKDLGELIIQTLEGRLPKYAVYHAKRKVGYGNAVPVKEQVDYKSQKGFIKFLSDKGVLDKFNLNCPDNAKLSPDGDWFRNASVAMYFNWEKSNEGREHWKKLHNEYEGLCNA